MLVNPAAEDVRTVSCELEPEWEVVVHGERSADLPVEYKAFEEVLQRRMTIDEDSSVLFMLYDLLIPPSTPDSLVVLHSGCKHLHLDCSCDD